jgi:hypothetical protein
MIVDSRYNNISTVEVKRRPQHAICYFCYEFLSRVHPHFVVQCFVII